MRTDAVNPVDREVIKEEIRGELRREAGRRRAFGCIGCLVVFVLLVGIPSVLVASFAAKTGLVEVPGFTRWMYRPAEPIRAVTPVAGADAAVIISSAVLKARPDLNTGLAHVPISEQQLSTVAAEFASRFAGHLPIKVSKVQVAVEPEFIEVFATVPRGNNVTTLRLRLAPNSDGQTLRLDLIELVIGGATVPKFIAGALTAPIRTEAVAGLQGIVSGAGQIVGIGLTRGSADFILRVNGF